jgi:hypothetical protein
VLRLWPVACVLQQEVLDGGYQLLMHPSDYSHMLFMVQLAPTCWRWSYMQKPDVWRHSSTKPARFKTSVARVGSTAAVVITGLRLPTSTAFHHVPLQAYVPSS